MSPDVDPSPLDGLAALSARIATCSACERLVEWRNEAARRAPKSHADETYWSRPLPGFGDPDARLVVIGLAPAAHGGNRTGRMFTGDRSGDFLVAGLFAAGFANQPTSRHPGDGLVLLDAYWTAPVRCAPPGNRPLPEERERCIGFLEQELALLERRRIYLALGAYAFESIGRLSSLRGRLGGRFAHGAAFHLEDHMAPATVLCSYHPSQRNVFTGLLTAEMFSDVLQRARQLLDQQ